MSESDRQLRAGINFTNAAELKYAHALTHHNQLISRIGEWNAAGGVLAYPHQIDAHTVELRALIGNPPPTDEWSLLLGDMIHNFRGIFDALVWEFAHLDHGTPPKPGRVTFPITEDQKDFDKIVRQDLTTIPADIVDRIRSLQPWANGEPRTNHFLWLLHRFDILDKHQRLIDAHLFSSNVRVHGIELNLQPPATPSTTYSITMRKHGSPIIENEMICTIHQDTHAINIDPNYRARVETAFRIIGEDERGAFLGEFMSGITKQVRETIDILTQGRPVAQALAEARIQTGSTLISTETNTDGTTRIQTVAFDPSQT